MAMGPGIINLQLALNRGLDVQNISVGDRHSLKQSMLFHHFDIFPSGSFHALQPFKKMLEYPA